jgi:hypothetical protein
MHDTHNVRAGAEYVDDEKDRIGKWIMGIVASKLTTPARSLFCLKIVGDCLFSHYARQ